MYILNDCVFEIFISVDLSHSFLEEGTMLRKH